MLVRQVLVHMRPSILRNWSWPVIPYLRSPLTVNTSLSTAQSGVLLPSSSSGRPRGGPWGFAGFRYTGWWQSEKLGKERERGKEHGVFLVSINVPFNADVVGLKQVPQHVHVLHTSPSSCEPANPIFVSSASWFRVVTTSSWLIPANLTSSDACLRYILLRWRSVCGWLKVLLPNECFMGRIQPQTGGDGRKQPTNHFRTGDESNACCSSDKN